MKYNGFMANPKHRIKSGVYPAIKLGMVTPQKAKKIALEQHLITYLYRPNGKLAMLFDKTGEKQLFK